MKRHMIRHKTDRGFLWIGKDAFSQAKEGKARILFYGVVQEL